MKTKKTLPIGVDEIRHASEILRIYRGGKTNLESRVVADEEWYRLRHWQQFKPDSADSVKPVSAWLLNVILSKHADAMDNYPTTEILPRECSDTETAEILSSVMPVILEQNGFEETYDSVWSDKLKHGTGVYGVFWDSESMGGLGDISIRPVDILNLFWEPGISDIQDSQNVFHTELIDNTVLKSRYPSLADKLGGTDGFETAHYIYDDNVDVSDKSLVIDWYYRKSEGGRTILHYCKFVGDSVLFASENEPDFKDGWYSHGEYPFVFDTLFKVKGTPCGFGYIDVGKNTQEYIDRGNQGIMMNLLANVRPRYFVSRSAGINAEEFADMSRDIVYADGNLGEDSVMPIASKGLSSVYLSVLDNKIGELKETTGNRDVLTGGSTGVTAASAIAALQESGNKLSRDMIKASYRAVRDVVRLVIELVREFYGVERYFRIIGEGGKIRFVGIDNSALTSPEKDAFGLDITPRIPYFDVIVNAEKSSPYSRSTQNDFALKLYQLGFFNPSLALQSLSCLEAMDFEGKERVIAGIMKNSGKILPEVESTPPENGAKPTDIYREAYIEGVKPR